MTSGRKIEEIERLRALAVIMVVWIHADFLDAVVPSVFRYGWTGVDLFFVISGFVVSTSLLRLLPRLDPKASFLDRMIAAQGALKTFFIRRYHRIFPLALLWLVAILYLSIFFNDAFYFGHPTVIGRQIYAFLTFQLNYLIATGIGLGTAATPYWSLSVEEHFYLLLPLLLVAAPTDNRRLQWVIGLVCATVAIRTLENTTGMPHQDLYERFASHRRFDGMLLGVGLAILRAHGVGDRWFARTPKRAFFIPVCLLTLAVFFGPAFMPRNTVPFPRGAYILGTLAVAAYSAILVGLASLERGFVFEIPILKNLLSFIGHRSYGIYLAHLPLLTLQRELLFRHPEWRISVGLQAVTFLGALFVTVEILYRGVELPLIRRGRALTPEAVPEPRPSRSALRA